MFGPVLHVATFEAGEIDRVIEDINATGYGLTFGLHSRIDDRVQSVADAAHAGNVYANRNQIGAIVGSQPFGGEGLSGTGPKAGGPHYVPRFARVEAPVATATWERSANLDDLRKALAASSSQPRETHVLPGPTGELNRLTTLPRPPMICAGPGADAAEAQRAAITALGGAAVATTGALDPAQLAELPEFGGVLWWGDDEAGRAYARALAMLPGPIIPLITGQPDKAHACLERHLCVDTTAAGGNADLLARATP